MENPEFAMSGVIPAMNMRLNQGDNSMKFGMAASVIWVIVLIASPGFAQEATFSKRELVEDLNTMWDSVKEHPKVYEYTSESTFNSLFQTIESQLQGGMTANDFLRIAHPLAVSIGCNHSILWPSMDDLGNPKGNTIPLTMTFQKEGAFVLSTYPAGQIPHGSKLLSINGIGVAEIEKILLGYFPADGLKNLGTKRSRAGMMITLLYPKLIEEAEDYRISYLALGARKVSDIQLMAFDTKSIWDDVMAENKQDPFMVEYREDSKTAIIKIKTFYFGGNNDPYNAFLDEVFSRIKKDKIENLILDLRNNSGGDPELAARLWSFIAREAVKYFEECEGYEKLLEPVELSDNHFSGNMYTLINGGGFSTAGHLVALIKYHKIGTIVGSELGCTFTCNDAAVNTVLKNTGNVARIARATFAVAVKDMKADQGVLPDYPVDFSVEDLVSGEDSELDLVFDLIHEAQ